MIVQKFAAIALCLCLAVPAAAQDVIGTLTGTVDDAPVAWALPATGEQPAALWIAMGGGMHSVLLMGEPVDAAADPHRLHVSFTALVAGGTTHLAGPEATYFTGGKDDTYQPEEGTLALTLDTLEEVDGNLHVQGSFSGTFYLVTDYATLALDKDKSHLVSGTYDATIPPRKK